jgi:hypothetical protein
MWQAIAPSPVRGSRWARKRLPCCSRPEWTTALQAAHRPPTRAAVETARLGVRKSLKIRWRGFDDSSCSSAKTPLGDSVRGAARKSPGILPILTAGCSPRLVHRGVQKIHLFGAPVSPDPRSVACALREG